MGRLLVVLAFMGASAFASHWIHLTGTYPIVNSSVDTLSNATFSRKQSTNSYVASLAYYFEVGSRIALGARYEYWLSDRRYDDAAGTTVTDQLSYQTVGAELGLHGGNQRVFWLISGGVFYPVAAAAGAYSATKSLEYQARAQATIRFVRAVWLIFEGGYRLANLGNLTSGTATFLDSGASLDLSGPFLSFGIAFHL
ncbi:MAG: hypothetical protein HYR96_06750 [Deltaproteobacteria bacterium]|nr:hypothetical protein [Deltaproteobacteria bacterium]MBI3296439.1 hypothetical protein [Deltaproteobacteria bacterium]